MTDKYFVYPDAGDQLWTPTSPDPMPLMDCMKSIQHLTTILQMQGHWRGDRGQMVPLPQVRFTIQHADYISDTIP